MKDYRNVIFGSVGSVFALLSGTPVNLPHYRQFTTLANWGTAGGDGPAA
ncbi:MAG TPA: hypothetical protein VGM62_11505 [Chthoniobacterales bacterium]